MARVNSETSSAHLSFDIAVAPTPKCSIDPTLIGVFDETLRRAREPDVDRAMNTTARSERPERRDDSRTSHTTSERRNRETEESPADNGEVGNVSNRETRSTDEAESGRPDEDSETACEEATAGTETDEDSVASDETSEDNETDTDTDTDADADADAAVAAVIEQAVVQVSEENTAEEGNSEEGTNAPSVEGTSPSQMADTETAETPASKSATELEVEQATVAVEGAEEAAEAAGENPEEEVAIEEEEGTVDSDSGEDAKSGERVDADATNASELPGTASDSEETLEETPEDEEPRKTEKRRTGANRREKHEYAASQTAGPPGTVAENAQGVPVEADPTTSEVQDPAAGNAPALTTPEVAAVDAGTPSDAPQTTNRGDAVTAVEGKGAANPGQTAAGQGSDKGTGQGVDAAKFVQRVASAFAALGQRSGPVRLKLYPPELGSLRMEITVKNGTMSARVEAETAAAKSALMDNLPVLRERLAEQGIKVDRFDVSLSDQSQGGSSERPDGDRSFRQSGGNHQPPTDTDTSESNTRNQTPVGQTFGSDGRLDIFI